MTIIDANETPAYSPTCSSACSLAELPIGGAAVVYRLCAPPPLALRLLTMGLTEGTPLEVIHTAPLGDPIEIGLRGYRLSLRRADAQCVQLTQVVLP